MCIYPFTIKCLFHIKHVMQNPYLINKLCHTFTKYNNTWSNCLHIKTTQNIRSLKVQTKIWYHIIKNMGFLNYYFFPPKIPAFCFDLINFCRLLQSASLWVCFLGNMSWLQAATSLCSFLRIYILASFCICLIFSGLISFSMMLSDM